MIRLVIYLVVLLAIASGLAWLADRPGSLVLTWQGYEIETSVFRAIVILALVIAAAMLIWTALRTVWMSPALLGRYMRKQRQRRGLDALSSGMIAISAGDRGTATKYAQQARKSLPNEPLTHLLRAQTAQLTGDRATAKRIYESMLLSPDTEQLGLRGLYLEANEMKEPEAARHFAARAMEANPALQWPVDATFRHQCQEENWTGALETLAIARRYGHIDKATADRRRAVLLTAKAQALEEHRSDEAFKLAQEAHHLANDLVPAAAIAGRQLASKGNTAKAAKILQRTWALSPHPDIATAYAYARIGDSPTDRLERVKKLTRLGPKDSEGPIAIAVAALEAREFDVARHALEPLLADRLTQRVATLMARVEGEQHGDKGRVREWLARAVTAGRDPAWTADGVVSEDWAPISPVTGELDAFSWRVPVERAPGQSPHAITAKAEELIAALAAAQQPTIEAVPNPDSPVPDADNASDVDHQTVEAARSTTADGDAHPPTTAATVPKKDSIPVSDREAASSTDGERSTAHDREVENDTNTVGAPSAPSVAPYVAKSGRKKKKKFQHTQASVAIKTEARAPSTKSEAAKTDTGDRSPIELGQRAPDDPGPDVGDQDDITNPLYKPYRTVSS